MQWPQRRFIVLAANELACCDVYLGLGMTQSAPTTGSQEPETISTGSAGLDDILGGGFDAERV